MANGLSILPNKGRSVFSNRPRGLPINRPNYIILDNGDFENLVLADKSLAKDSLIFETSILFNNHLCRE